MSKPKIMAEKYADVKSRSDKIKYIIRECKDDEKRMYSHIRYLITRAYAEGFRRAGVRDEECLTSKEAIQLAIKILQESKKRIEHE